MSRYREISLSDGEILFSEGETHPSVRENTRGVEQTSGCVGQTKILLLRMDRPFKTSVALPINPLTEVELCPVIEKSL